MANLRIIHRVLLDNFPDVCTFQAVFELTFHPHAQQKQLAPVVGEASSSSPVIPLHIHKISNHKEHERLPLAAADHQFMVRGYLNFIQ